MKEQQVSGLHLREDDLIIRVYAYVRPALPLEGRVSIRSLLRSTPATWCSESSCVLRKRSEANLQGRVLYLDLDTVITGCLEDIAAYSGPFAALSVAGMANERRPVGLNSSVMSWDAGREKSVQAVYDLLQEAYMPVSENAFQLCVP